MKTRLIILIMLISCSFTYSQIINSIGFKSGVTLSDQNWQHSEVTFEYYFNTHASNYSAITVGFFNNVYWELTADLGIYQSSSKTEYNKYNYDVTKLGTPVIPSGANVNIGFFTFSPAIKFKKQIKSFTPYVFIGPRIDYYYSGISSSNANVFKDEFTKKPIWGFNIGEGVSYKIKDISLSLEYQFLYSYNYVIDKPLDNPDFALYYNLSRETLRTYTHVITLGIKYHFTKK